MRRGIWLVVVLGLCLCIGCGRKTGVEGLVKVSGTVNFQGNPVEGATVMFAPDGGGRAASGRTDATGKFQLTTLNPNDGALPGKYKVSVSKVENIGPESQITAEQMAQMVSGGMAAPMGPKEPSAAKAGDRRYHVPQKYGNVETSELSADVTEAGPNDFTFDLVE